ncbi:hypothetical protein SULI_00150 [Saccharolobus solfataricus]|nr:hypothetical protein [Saccharolobus solfataricus]AKA72485.1 hypothetical protein SULB_0030 [Saccharolobus solfataricus]AKA75185.1 hypothetical protein SULC_0029 [Saccharolobus solfataricus]AKA77878.1 hypothetical protein SULA_0029 [Saccharolobus solfataricus]AZF66999.1 hypothetical protein SULG_00150 [Saccharolobus solfataricus]AZF69619.1 hypothetical protein SULH_00150 [Saccharolobus solfataricus]
MSVKFEESSRLLEAIKSMLASATSSILIVTYGIDQEAASEILTKAASGVNTVLVTADKDWARWLKNQAEAYKKDEEKRLYRELRRNETIYTQIIYFTLIISIAIAIIDIILYFMMGTLVYYDVPLSIIAIGFLIYYGIRRRKEALSQISILRESAQNFVQEVGQIRQKIKEKLKIIEIDNQVSFSIVSCDDKTILFSAPLKFSMEKSSVHVVMEISKQLADQLVNLILKIS